MTDRWTYTAIEHLLAIYEYIAVDSPVYAQRMVDKITRRSQQLANFPRSGRLVPEYQTPDIYEVIEKPYRIIYRVMDDTLDILAIIHGAQSLPSRTDID